MGKASRAKGRRGESAVVDLLTARDWSVADLTAGKAGEDLLVVDPDGVTWAVEVKTTKAITTAHRSQAMAQAQARRAARWMLVSKIEGTSSWLVQRQGQRPVVWHAQNSVLSSDETGDQE